ncbi:MAG: hypothetical protein EBR83_08605, partial [Verrucomicrobia bacterium]|nr:hypothetical protein [Verrucomicrobiota bacterium]
APATATASSQGLLGMLYGGSGASITLRPLGQGATNAIVGGASANSTLTIDQDTTTTYVGAIGGTGTNENNVSIVKSGVGTLNLAGSVLSYTGKTSVTGGRLNITGSAATPLATSGVAVSAGAILNFFNGVGQSLTLSSTAGSLNLGAGTSGGAALGLELGSTSNYDRLATAGSAVVANKVLLNLTGLTGLQAGQYDLITAQSGLSGGTFSIGNLANFGGFSFALNTSDTAVSLVTTALTPNLYWRVGSDVSWSSLDYANNYNTNFYTDAAGTTNAKGFPGIANKVIFSTTTSPSTPTPVRSPSAPRSSSAPARLGLSPAPAPTVPR